MKTYDGNAVDSYMRSILTQDLTPDEADNALTLLTTLTTVAEKLFPADSTFIRVNKHRSKANPENVRVQGVVFFNSTEDEEGYDRSLHIPLIHLNNLKTAMNSLFGALTVRDLVQIP